MEKNIAVHDLSDMMVFEGMQTQSKKILLAQALSPFKKAMDYSVNTITTMVGSIKRAFKPKALAFTEVDEVFADTKKAIYAIAIASGAISFFWFALLISA